MRQTSTKKEILKQSYVKCWRKARANRMCRLRVLPSSCYMTRCVSLKDSYEKQHKIFLEPDYMIRNAPICQTGLFCKVATSALFSYNFTNFDDSATFNRVLVLKAANCASLCKI